MAEFAKKFRNLGATILGGCCETRPTHIKEIAKLISWYKKILNFY